MNQLIELRRDGMSEPELNTLDDYRNFLESKVVVAKSAGFDVAPDELHPGNFPHQNDAIIWAGRLGRALISMNFGLGKTRIQCELARLIVNRTGRSFLVICPLGVKHQFQEEDGPSLGQDWIYVRTDAECQSAESPYLITNYERVRDGNITEATITLLGGVSLDEGSVLRSLGSKTQVLFNEIFREVPYRYVATATPSPNRYIELINYADFLDVMDRGQALTRWFKRDSTHAGNLTLHPQHEHDFWMWVSTWSLFVDHPALLCDCECHKTGADGCKKCVCFRYNLPDLHTHWERIAVDQRRAFESMDNRGQRRLLLDPAGGVKEALSEKRATLSDRVAMCLRIVMEHPEDQWVVWCHLNAEQDAVYRAFTEAGLAVSSITGSQSIEEKERRVYEWKRKETVVLLSKPEILGSGLNLQQCHRVVFLGIDYRFQDFIQAIHRNHRFQQPYPVDVHILYAESEDDVVKTMQAKWQLHNQLVDRMREIIKKYGLAQAAIRGDLTRQIGVSRMEINGKLFTAVNNDCVVEIDKIADSSVGLIHTSIPFGNHYEYSVQYEDFGHNPTDNQFWRQMDFLIPKLLRVLKPGRVAAIHVKDRILYGHQTTSGFMEVSPFSDDCVVAFRKHGFLYEGRRTIVTDVVRENNSTYRLGWTEMSRDSSKMGSGLPEYLLLFRKAPTDPTTARADEPVMHPKYDTETYICGDCGYKLSEKDSGLEILEKQDGIENGLTRRYYAVCPSCNVERQFNRKHTGGYSRGRWQIDAHSFWRSNGNTPLTPEEFYDYLAHVKRLESMEDAGNLPASFFYEPPKSFNHWVWDDVVYMRTLNSNQSLKRRESHICPLPFDIVERTIELYSNPGDVVLDPFGGLFTVPYMAIKLGRYGHGIELNPEYFQAGVGYCQEIEREKLTPTLFDYLATIKASEQIEVAGD